MDKKEYSLQDGYLYLSDEDGSWSVVYNRDKTKCICLTTGCEFDFTGNDKPDFDDKTRGEHSKLINAMKNHYGVCGNITLIPFRELLSAFAPDLRRTEYMTKAFTKKELQCIEPFISRILKSFTAGKKTISQLEDEEVVGK